MNTRPLPHMLAPVALAVLVNGWIYGTGMNRKYGKPNPYIPPGYAIATIWMAIFALLGYAHYLLGDFYSAGSLGIAALILFCLAYPFITGLSQELKVLNLATLILSFSVALLVIQESVYAFCYLVPLLVWASWVNMAFILDQ